MINITKEELIKNLHVAPEFLELSHRKWGSTIISEYGGRPIGMFPEEEIFNLIWVNPDLSEKIRNYERNIGGSRYWISPERTFFYKNPERWEGWFCPPGLDPAYYKFTKKSTSACTLKSMISIQNQFTKDYYDGQITRDIKLIDEPINTGLNFCGIEIIDECIIDKPDLNINGWTLTNVVSGGPENPGNVLIPTRHKVKPLSYFRTIPQDRIIVEENYVNFKIDVDDIYKLAIRPEDIDFQRNAKIGYLLRLPGSEDYGFLVKLSNDLPTSQEDCFDIARDHPDSEIGVIQSYNSESPNKSKLRYGEIELQLNKFLNFDGNSKCISIHRLLAYIGSREDIIEVVDKYLGISDLTVF